MAFREIRHSLPGVLAGVGVMIVGSKFLGASLPTPPSTSLRVVNTTHTPMTVIADNPTATVALDSNITLTEDTIISPSFTPEALEAIIAESTSLTIEVEYEENTTPSNTAFRGSRSSYALFFAMFHAAMILLPILSETSVYLQTILAALIAVSILRAMSRSSTLHRICYSLRAIWLPSLVPFLQYSVRLILGLGTDQEKIWRLEECIDEKETTINALRAQFQTAKKSNEQEVTCIKDHHQEGVKALQEQHRQEMIIIRMQIQNDVAKTQESDSQQHATMVAEINDRHQEEILELKNEIVMIEGTPYFFKSNDAAASEVLELTRQVETLKIKSIEANRREHETSLRLRTRMQNQEAEHSKEMAKNPRMIELEREKVGFEKKFIREKRLRVEAETALEKRLEKFSRIQKDDNQEWNEYCSTLTAEHIRTKKAAKINDQEKDTRINELEKRLKASQTSQSTTELSAMKSSFNKLERQAVRQEREAKERETRDATTIRGFENDRAKLDSLVKDLSAQLTQKEQTHQQSMLELQSQINKAHDQANEKIRCLESHAKDAQNQSDEKIRGLEAQVRDAQDQANEKPQILESQEKNSQDEADKKIRGLEDELTKARDSLGKLTESHETIKAKLNKCAKMGRKTLDEYFELKKERNQLSEQLTTVTNAHGSLKVVESGLRQELQDAQEQLSAFMAIDDIDWSQAPELSADELNAFAASAGLGPAQNGEFGSGQVQVAPSDDFDIDLTFGAAQEEQDHSMVDAPPEPAASTDVAPQASSSNNGSGTGQQEELRAPRVRPNIFEGARFDLNVSAPTPPELPPVDVTNPFASFRPAPHQKQEESSAAPPLNPTTSTLPGLFQPPQEAVGPEQQNPSYQQAPSPRQQLPEPSAAAPPDPTASTMSAPRQPLQQQVGPEQPKPPQQLVPSEAAPSRRENPISLRALSEAGQTPQRRPNKVEDCDFELFLDDDNPDEEREMDPYEAAALLAQDQMRHESHTAHQAGSDDDDDDEDAESTVWEDCVHTHQDTEDAWPEGLNRPSQEEEDEIHQNLVINLTKDGVNEAHTQGRQIRRARGRLESTYDPARPTLAQDWQTRYTPSQNTGPKLSLYDAYVAKNEIGNEKSEEQKTPAVSQHAGAESTEDRPLPNSRDEGFGTQAEDLASSAAFPTSESLELPELSESDLNALKLPELSQFEFDALMADLRGEPDPVQPSQEIPDPSEPTSQIPHNSERSKQDATSTTPQFPPQARKRTKKP